VPRGILAAKLLHAVAILALVGFGAGARLGWLYYLGVAIGAVIIVWEHHLVRPGDLSRLDAAFFTANGIVSIVVFLGALGDRLVKCGCGLRCGLAGAGSRTESRDLGREAVAVQSAIANPQSAIASTPSSAHPRKTVTPNRRGR
jgi:hypothetical protein